MRWSVDRHREALRFAADAHRDQKVPGSGHPYVVHVVSVCAEVIDALAAEPGSDEDLAITCALLHDTVEDTEVTRDQIAARFGAAVADGVAALSKNEALPKADRLADSLARIRTQPREIWMVKLADRVINLTPPVPPSWSDDKRTAYRAEGEQILSALVDASAHLAARLRARIDDYR